jgi:hypothetical protein
MFWDKIVISDPLLYRRPLLLRQPKNNQNQTNTTGALNFKEFNNTAGWLSVFFENKKELSSHLIIWTSTLSIIRIEKLFVIGN